MKQLTLMLSLLEKLNIQATLTSPVVSMGNSMHSGKPLGENVMYNYRGSKEIICSRDYNVTIGSVTNNHVQ